MSKFSGFHIFRFPFSESIKVSSLYNTKEYLQNYAVENLYRLVWIEEDVVVAQVNLYIRDNKATNAPFSSFGGIDHCLSANLLEKFVGGLSHWCSTMGIETITLKLPPPVYGHNSSITEQVLSDNGFDAISDDVNQHINISDLTFTSIIRKNEQKRLRKCHGAGFRFRRMNTNELKIAYELINDNRLRKGFPMTMTYQALEKMYRVFPKKYLLFGVYDKEKLIATSVSIQVTSSVLYNFYHGDAEEYLPFSPIVMVIEGVYIYCQQKNISTLDLGISSVSGGVNQGLFTFKRNCGAKSSSKKILRKMLH